MNPVVAQNNNSTEIVTQLESYLRMVYEKSVGLSRLQQSRLLQICLTYKISKSQYDVSEILPALLAAIGYSFKYNFERQRQHLINSNNCGAQLTSSDCANIRDSNSAQNNLTEKLLIELVSIFYKNTTKEAQVDRQFLYVNNCQNVDAVFKVLNIFTRQASRSGLTLLEMLDKVHYQAKAADNAVESASQELFTRLLQSLDPKLYERIVEKNIFESKNAYKAHLYDLMCEKYQQLNNYNQNGRFAKDCQAKFRHKLEQNEN